MASNIFNYTPTSGNGNTIVTAFPIANNGTRTNLYSHVTVRNGTNTALVTLKQKYCPYFLQFASKTFPNTGGTIYFTIHSEYDIVFRSVPDWITISYNGTTFTEGQRLSAVAVNDKTFELTATRNTGADRSVSSTFNMGHFIGNTVQTAVTYFTFSQPGGAPLPSDITFSPTSASVYADETAFTLTVTESNCTWDALAGVTYHSSNPDFSIIEYYTSSQTSPKTIRFTIPENYLLTRVNTNLSITVRDTQNNTYTHTVYVSHLARGEA